MPRTTVDIDASVLRELKRRGRREGKSVGRLISELLAVTLKKDGDPDAKPFDWRAQAMRTRVDVDDKEALHKVLDGR
jgi:hypothetical protein